MKTRISKILSVIMALAMAFTAFSCVTYAAEAQDVIVDGVISPALASGTVSALPLDNCVQAHAIRLHTVNHYLTADHADVIVSENCRAYVQFFNADGTYKGGSGWIFAGTHTISAFSAASGAKYFKITFDSADGSTTPPTDGLKITQKAGGSEQPEEPEQPVEPEEPDTGVKVKPQVMQGTIDSSKNGEVNAAVTTRVYSDYIYITDIQSVTIGSDYKAGYHFYDETGAYISGHIGGWQYGKKTGAELAAMASGATYVKIVVGKKNDTELYPETLADDAVVISLVEGLDQLTKPDVKPELPPLAEDPDVKINFGDYSLNRGNGLKNTFAKLNKGEEINVLYMGGSVTNGTGSTDYELNSWRGIVSNWFAHNAGNGKVNNVNVAYGDTCTLFGSYRLRAEILPEEPDLIFVEFAINDMYNSKKRGYGEKESTMQFETIVRTIRKELPDCDIVTVLTADSSTFDPNTLHKYAQVHENVSIKYNIPSIHVGRALAKEIALTGNSWSSTYAWTTTDIAHPNDLGHSVYAGTIKAYLAEQLEENGANTVVTKHTIPEMISDKLLDGNIQFIDADEALITASEALGGSGFAYSSGASNLAKSGTNIFKGGVYSKNENDKLFVKFTGTELAMIEYQAITGFSVSVDGGDFYTITRDSVKPVILATDLQYGEHTVCIKPIFSSNSSSFHIQGFFTRNQNATTLSGSCDHVYDDDFDTDCNVCGSDRVLGLDINSDDRVDVCDLVALGDAIEANQTLKEENDLNGDGKFDNEDVSALRKALLRKKPTN